MIGRGEKRGRDWFPGPRVAEVRKTETEKGTDEGGVDARWIRPTF